MPRQGTLRWTVMYYPIFGNGRFWFGLKAGTATPQQVGSEPKTACVTPLERRFAREI